MEAQKSFALTGNFNGRLCVATVLSTKRGFVAECFSVSDTEDCVSLGNPAFFSSYDAAVKAVRMALNA